jgi:thioredoxin 1
MSPVIEVSDHDFDEHVLRAEQPVVVDVYGESCPPCRVIGPVVDQLAEAYPDVRFVKVDVAESFEIAAQYGVTGIPTLLLFRGGEVVDRLVGAQPAALREKVAALAG